MNSPILFQAGIPILLIIVIVGVVQLRRRWNAWHLVFSVLLFIMSVVFMGFAALSLKTRNWLEYRDRMAERLTQVEEQADKLLYGDPTEVNAEPSVTDLRAALTRTMIDRGRVWRDCLPTELANGTVTVTTTPQGMDPATAPANGIDEKDVLYVFQELDVQGDGVKVPVLYMGEFRVDSRTDQSVTMSPLLPLDAAQQAQLQSREGTWALYEVIPIDSHLAFAENPEARPDLETDSPLFGQWDPARIQGFFQPSIELYQRVMGASLPADFAALATQELLPTPVHPMQDGYLLTQEQIDSGGAEVDENTWIKVRFLKNWKLNAEEVNDTAQSGLSSTYYSTRGRAVIDFLRRADGDDYTFTRDQIALFRKVPEGQTVQPEDDILSQLLSEGFAEQMAPYYVRPLVDFDRAYHSVVIQISKLRIEDGEITRAIEFARADQQSTLKQIAEGQKQKANLLKERQLFFAEREQITQYTDGLNSKVEALRKALNEMARRNLELAAELTQLQNATAGVAAK